MSYRERFTTSLSCVSLFTVAALSGLVPALAQARSLEEIRGSGELRTCLVPVPEGFAVEPADCRENCKFSGDLYDLAIAFAESLGAGIKAKILRVEWDEQFFDKDGKTHREETYTPQLLESGACDVYETGLTKLPWRESKMEFVTLYPTRMVVVVHKSRKSDFTQSTDLCGKSAATVTNTSYHLWMQRQNDSVCATNPIRMQFMTFEETSKAVDSGQADFRMDNFDNTLWQGTPYRNSVSTFAVGSTVEQGWAFRRKDKDLQAAARKFLDEQGADPRSVWNQQWKKGIGMTLHEYLGRVPK